MTASPFPAHSCRLREQVMILMDELKSRKLFVPGTNMDIFSGFSL